MTIKAAAAPTSRCGFHSVISQQEDNVLKRNGEKGVAEWEKKQKHTTVQCFNNVASQCIASRMPCNILYIITQQKHTKNYFHVGIKCLMVSNYVFCLFCKYLSSNS